MTTSSEPSGRSVEGRPSVPSVPRVPWQVFLSEMTGTPVLLLGGLSLVILAFGAGSPIAALVPSVKLRQMIGIGRFAIGGAYRESAVNRGRSTAEPPRV